MLPAKNVVSEVNRRECISHTPLPSANKAAQFGFETQRRHHQKYKSGVLVAPRKDLCLPKIINISGSVRITHADSLTP